MTKHDNGNKKVRIYWPDYTITKGKNARQALLKIGKKQWKMKTDILEIKKMLSVRALNWSNAVIDPSLPSEEFLTELGKSGMVFVWYGDGDPFLGTKDSAS